MTTTNTARTSFLERRKLPIMVGVVALALIALAQWAGRPEKQAGLFFAGIALLVGALVAYGLLVWHLMMRPLPAGYRTLTASMVDVNQRRLLSVLILIGGIGLVVGGFWDEVWHRSYGFPFGPDLLWRPHLLIYTGFLIIPGLAIYGLMRLLRRGKGSLQQRFRADPVLGYLTLAGGFFILLVPSDPIWHLIYGDDISAWSLPHVMLLLGVTLAMLLASMVLLSTTPAKAWSSLLRISPWQVLVLAGFTFVLALQLQVLATDWENINSMALRRPDWLLPVIFVVLATLNATLANHALRGYGAATAVGLLALLIRFGLIQAFGFDSIDAATWLPILPPLVALDLWCAYRTATHRGPAPPAADGVVAALALTAVSLPLINQLFTYPQIASTAILWSALAGFIAATISAWIGGSLGDYLASANKRTEGVQPAGRALRLAAPLLFVGFLAFVVFFVVTATPPA